MMINAHEFQRKARNATIIALGVNIFLGLIKITIGLYISSISLIADGFDSMMDIAIGVFAFLAIRVALRPADKSHSFGHEKFESLFSLGISLVIFITGVGIGVNALFRVLNSIALEFSIIGFFVIIISVIGKLAISFYVLRVSKQINSISLRASAINYAIDIISSILVFVAIVGSYFNLGIIDSISALIICLIIFYEAFEIGKEAIEILVDKSPENIDEIVAFANTLDGVRDAHRLRARKIGTSILGDIHILVDPDLSVRDGHEISELVTAKINEKFSANIIVHLEPYLKDN